jgi:hypothetical protein
MPLANERRFLTDIDERELRGVEKVCAAKHQASDTDEPQQDAKPRHDMKPKRCLEGTKTGS